MTHFITSSKLTSAGFKHHGFTTHVDYSFDSDIPKDTIRQNLLELKSTLKTELPLLRVNQVHGNGVLTATDLLKKNCGPWDLLPSIDGDAILSDGQSACLAVQTADCVPVLIASPDTGEVAVIHAGWRGLQKGIIRITLKQMQNKGASAENIIAAIGPCICLNCYQVGEDVAKHFPESVDPVKGNPGKYQMDIGLAAEVSLIASGLFSTNIDKIDTCTSCGEQDLFSYRKSDGNCGRQLAFICTLKE